MKNLAMFLCMLALALIALYADAAGVRTPNQLLQEANDDYSAGRFTEAARVYRDILGEYGLSAEVLHNLGNSYAAQHRHGQAILQYLRGLRLEPGDDDLRADLVLTREETGLFRPQQNFRDRLFGILDMNQWLLSALTGYTLLTVLLVCHFFRPLTQSFFLGVPLLIILMALSCFGALQQYRMWDGSVVVDGRTRLLLSPFASAAPMAVLEEGTVVFSENRHGEYHYVDAGTAGSGWIPASSLERIRTSRLKFARDNAAR
ncbi:MAG TPA: hypothetical protein VJ969_12050 [Desulfopila sp.]|nr:hypothetical protein [Desulfopila sp.]